MDERTPGKEYFTKVLRDVVDNNYKDVMANLEMALQLGLMSEDEALARIFLGREYVKKERSREGIEQIEKALQIASNFERNILNPLSYAIIAECYSAEVSRLMSDERVLNEELVDKANKYINMASQNVFDLGFIEMRAQVSLDLGRAYFGKQLNEGNVSASDLAITELEKGINSIESIKGKDDLRDIYNSYSGELHFLLGLVYVKHNSKLVAEHIKIAASRGNSRAKEMMEEYPADFEKSQEKTGIRCFIATAVYGTPHNAEIQLLRAFKDEYLARQTLGKIFVSFYYRVSPPLAIFIKQHKVIRRATKILLLKPIVYIIGHFQKLKSKEA